MTTRGEAFLDPQGSNRFLNAEVSIGRRVDMVSPRQDVITFSLTPSARHTDDEFKRMLLAELSEMIRSDENPDLPHMHKLEVTETHVNWGASGDVISLLLDVSEAIPPAVIGFYVNRILERFSSREEDPLSRANAIETATMRVVTAYAVERSELRHTGEEGLRDGGWRIHFSGINGETFKVDIDSRGVTYISRSTE